VASLVGDDALRNTGRSSRGRKTGPQRVSCHLAGVETGSGGARCRAVPLPRPTREVTVYECPACEARYSASSTAATAEAFAVASGQTEPVPTATSLSPSTTSSLLQRDRMIHQEAVTKFHDQRVNLLRSPLPLTFLAAVQCN